MRPTPDELAAGMRAMLREAGAELTSAGATAQVRRIMYILRDGRWADAAFDLLHENRTLAGMLSALGPAGDGPAALPADDPLPRDFAEANARNLALRTALAAGLDALRRRPLADSAELRRMLATELLKRP